MAAKTKSVPVRMCIACREMIPKKELLRVAKGPDGTIGLDFSGKAPGRGAYLCGKSECILKLKKQRLLNKAFSAEVPLEVYARIEEEFFGKGKN